MVIATEAAASVFPARRHVVVLGRLRCGGRWQRPVAAMCGGAGVTNGGAGRGDGWRRAALVLTLATGHAWRIRITEEEEEEWRKEENKKIKK